MLSTLVLLGGDANDNNEIGIGDASIIGGQYGNSGSGITMPKADINADDVVDILDLVIMGGNFDKKSTHCSPPRLRCLDAVRLSRITRGRRGQNRAVLTPPWPFLKRPATHIASIPREAYRGEVP